MIMIMINVLRISGVVRGFVVDEVLRAGGLERVVAVVPEDDGDGEEVHQPVAHQIVEQGIPTSGDSYVKLGF